MTARNSLTQNLRVRATARLTTPAELQRELPLSTRAEETIAKARAEIRQLLTGEDRRLLVVVGPCSIHDLVAAREYADFIEKVRAEHAKALCILMRVYFEKPRTTTGWKGLLNDPRLDGSYDIEAGLRIGRGLLVELAERGLPAASEVLDPIAPQYLGDVIAWAAIGARTIESQTHREMASGLSMPVGFKNGTDGTIDGALNAMRSSAEPHHFLGIDPEGRVALVATAGNRDTHLVLRGGAAGPNFDADTVGRASQALARHGLCPRVMIDCSHGNSQKDYRRQPTVAAAVAEQVRSHRNANLGADPMPVLGVMIESHLQAGNQPFPPPPGTKLRYGTSITDGCVDLTTTREMLAHLAEATGCPKR